MVSIAHLLDFNLLGVNLGLKVSEANVNILLLSIAAHDIGLQILEASLERVEFVLQLHIDTLNFSNCWLTTLAYSFNSQIFLAWSCEYLSRREA